MTNEMVTFDARFGGVPHSVVFPVAAVLGIYARESGQGMMFQDEPAVAATQPASPAATAEKPAAAADSERPRPKPGGPGLRLVK
jgi:stringent starvation protein B